MLPRVQPLLSIATNQSGPPVTYPLPSLAAVNSEYLIVVQKSSNPLVSARSEEFAITQGPGSPCDAVSCENGGFCLVEDSEPICACPDGFTGLQCEFGATAVLRGFTRRPQRLVVALSEELPLTVANPNACAELCAANISCKGFDVGVSWTDQVNQCSLTSLSPLDAGKFF